MPKNADFDPPDNDVMQMIVTTDSPTVTILDEHAIDQPKFPHPMYRPKADTRHSKPSSTLPTKLYATPWVN